MFNTKLLLDYYYIRMTLQTGSLFGISTGFFWRNGGS